MYVAILVILIILIVIIAWWSLGVAAVVYPSPSRPDANFQALIDDFMSYPKELWFRNNKEVFDRELGCSNYRYVVLESDGDIVYVSEPYRKGDRDNDRKNAHRSDDSHYDSHYDNRYTDPRIIPRTVEYQRATSSLQGEVLRDNTLNLCVAVKEGSVWRLVHVSQYIFNQNDPEF